MPNIVEWSLIVIAAAFAAAVIALVPALLQLRRTAARAETVLAGVGGELPGLLSDLRSLLVKLDRMTDALATIATSVDRLDRLAETTLHAVEGTWETARQKMRAVVLAAAANGAGVLAAVREATHWVQPGRNGERRSVHLSWPAAATRTPLWGRGSIPRPRDGSRRNGA